MVPQMDLKMILVTIWAPVVAVLSAAKEHYGVIMFRADCASAPKALPIAKRSVHWMRDFPKTARPFPKLQYVKKMYSKECSAWT